MTANRSRSAAAALLAGALALTACEGPQGPAGAAGPPGPAGANGTNGTNGKDGTNGTNGTDGTDGTNGTNGSNGTNGTNGTDGRSVYGVTAQDPLSGTVALTYVGTEADNVADYVKLRVGQVATGALPSHVVFPLEAASTDSVRAISGIGGNVVAKWLDPTTYSTAASADRFGANVDYLAFFGDGSLQPAAATPAALSPIYKGSGRAGWMWVNHEYVSGAPPRATAAPTFQHNIFSRFLANVGLLPTDLAKPRRIVENGNALDVYITPQEVDTYVREWKRTVGGSLFRVVQNPSTLEWEMDRAAGNRRFDATSRTLATVTGQALVSADVDDSGNALPRDVIPGVKSAVVAGIAANCSGGQTPWGTIITAEENAQDHYGDLEAAWDGQNAFLAGRGFDPGANVSPTLTPSSTSVWGASTVGRHARETQGYLVEMDPSALPGDYYGKAGLTAGAGHRKLGALGRARWENAAFATDASFQLVPGRPVVIYGGDDRRGGRIFKFVTNASYTAGMTRAQVRALLDDGKLYVAHFAGLDNATGVQLANGTVPTSEAPGTGRWVHLSVDSTDVAPNAGATAAMPAGTTVGAALRDVSWNGIGGFPTDDDVRRALFTASNKIGVMELNRPEDIEFNPRDPSGTPTLYVAFTNHTARTALKADGTLNNGATREPARTDNLGSLFAMREMSDVTPGDTSDDHQFQYFRAWRGSKTAPGADGLYDAGSPDNIMIDADGGVWFGTDGNFGTNGHADALYYLDLDPAHRATPVPTYGKAFRVVAGPSDSEATGPAFSPDMRTLFFNVQHPGEDQYSTWPRR
jgi:secreted PhoX family phosphatase